MTKSCSVIFVRVSKEEKEYQNPEDQIDPIVETFKLNLNDCEVITERISAYDEKKQSYREEFIKLKERIDSGDVKKLYVWSLERIERNQQRMLEFFFFCEQKGCKIYSALQPFINNLLPKVAEKSLEGNPIYSFIRYIIVLLYAFLSENESWFISVRTKKAFHKTLNSTYTKDNNKVGRLFKNSKGEPVKITAEDDDVMFKFVCDKIRFYEKAGMKNYYPMVIDAVQKNFSDIVISKAYLYSVRKKIMENNG